MKKILKSKAKMFLCFAAVFASCLFCIACDYDPCTYHTGDTAYGKMVVVTYNDSVVYQSPCGYVSINNPIVEKAGGGILEGAAIATLPVVTVSYHSKLSFKDFAFGSSYDDLEQVKNFPITDQNLTFETKICHSVVTPAPACRNPK